jgi:hypothetical protein
MPHYQVRFFDADGRFWRAFEMDCVGDDEALERLAHMHHAFALELWEAERLVWRFDSPPAGGRRWRPRGPGAPA